MVISFEILLYLSVHYLIYQDILKILTPSLSVDMLVFKNSLPANFKFEDLKNQYNQNLFSNVYKSVSSGNDNFNFFFNV